MYPKALTLSLAAVFVGGAVLSSAQNTEPAAKPTPDDTPSIKVGATLFTNYTYTDEPKATDADKNSINPSSFEVTRAYVNVTGSISHLLSFRITPDIAGRLATTATSTSTVTGGAPGEKVTTTTTASTGYDGNLVYRLKYAYGQLNLDEWTTKGTWVRLGQQGTPYTDLIEPTYRYRFQGNVFVEKEGFVSTSDVGLGAHYSLPSEYGDIQAGVYNGEGYQKAETNDQKALQVRLTVRPLPKESVLKGLRLTGFYDADHYVSGDARNRAFGALTFEHKNINAGAEYLTATDQPTLTAAEVKAEGYSLWATPRTNVGIEGLFRYDNIKPNKDVSANKTRTVIGVAYWFKTQKLPATAAILADYEHVTYDAQPAGSIASPVVALGKPTETRYALHGLLTF
jgi:hypothetical protein